MGSVGYHHRYPTLLMLENNPPHDPADLEVEEEEPVEEEEEEEARVRLKGMSDVYIELEKIPPRLWEQTLAAVRRQKRYGVVQRIPDRSLRALAMTLIHELDMAESAEADTRARARNAALRTGYALPDGGPGHASARSAVQVNLRLRRDDHERLAQAAAAVGLKPTTLARSLVLNGAAMILREQGREHLTPPARTRSIRA